MMRSNVWITGVGAVSSAGGDTKATLENFREGRRSPVMTLPFESTVAAPTFQVFDELPTLSGRRNNSRTLRLTMRALNEAMGDAGIERFDASTRVGVCIGTTVASQLNCMAFYMEYRATGMPDLDPIYDYLQANLAEAVGDSLGVTGPRMTVVNACSSGTDAIGTAAAWIRAGLCDVAIAGGADEINRVPLAGFWSLGVMSTEPCTPFDANRTGLNLGEGAGIVVLESESRVKERSKTASFQVAGYGAACDAHHLTAPHPEGRGLESAIRTAMTQASISPADIAFINAHGTATQDNDRAEGKVIDRLFGKQTPFLSTKGYTGHTLGAAGGLEAVFSILGLREKWIPKNVGFDTTAEDVLVSPVRERTDVIGEYAMSTSLAFGGNNAALILRRVS